MSYAVIICYTWKTKSSIHSRYKRQKGARFCFGKYELPNKCVCESTFVGKFMLSCLCCVFKAILLLPISKSSSCSPFDVHIAAGGTDEWKRKKNVCTRCDLRLLLTLLNPSFFLSLSYRLLFSHWLKATKKKNEKKPIELHYQTDYRKNGFSEWNNTPKAHGYKMSVVDVP